MTALAGIISERIIRDGPMSVADFMELCLAHPRHGYYRTRDPLGLKGDFTTSPEISQMFGEIIGLWAAEVWQSLGRPRRFALVELGPGRGTLMQDALRAAALMPEFRAAAEVWLVETSPVLRAEQGKRIAGAQWADALQEVPDLPLILIANEFFDALPVRQFVREGNVWRERVVRNTGGGLGFGIGGEVAGLDELWPGVSPATVAEVSPAGQAIAGQIGERLCRWGGAALVVDYGAWHGTGDTLQALSRHQMADPLAQPGEADLTAHVNFSILAAAAAPAKAWPLLTQGDFLTRLGIADRAERLARMPGQRATVALALRRLTGAAEMGSLFKVLCMTGADALAPPGFET